VIELQFVDYARLQSYAEQIGRRNRWVPSFSGTLGLTGPSVSATFERQQLSKVHEQLNAVRRYLEKERLVDYDLQADRGGEAPFSEETLSLRNVYIAPSGDHPLLKNGLSLWISDQLQRHAYGVGLLLLIEQFPLPDEHSARYITGGTLLKLLRDEFVRYELTAGREDSVPPLAEYETGSWPDGRKLATLRTDLDIPEIPGIEWDALAALKSFGARVGPAKTLTVLYRARLSIRLMHGSISPATIGYPIAIWLSL
jgi:hypothetical protein